MAKSADTIIEKFGGVPRLAEALGHDHITTVHAWKRAGYIPYKHHESIMAASNAQGCGVEPTDFLNVGQEESA